MTDKEKARAYDEALKRAKKFAIDEAYSSQGTVAKLIFPELAESEDERITRAINNMLPFIPDEAYANNGVTKESVLNWLEKQKESLHIAETCKENTNSFTDEDEDRTINGCLLAANAERRCKRASEELLEELGLADYTKFFYEQGVEKGKKEREKQKEQKPIRDIISGDAIESCMLRYLQSAANRKDDIEIIEDTKKYKKQLLEIVKQKEQKPAEWDELQSEFRSINEAFEDGKKEVIEHPEKYGLYKPEEWDEKDKRMLNVAIRSCEQTIEDYPNDKVRFNDCIDWLKALPLNLKKKNEDVAKLCSNEWSEEDEKMLVRLLDSISIGNDYEEMRNWLLPKLKSLRPQSKGTYKQVIHTIFGMLKDKDFYEIQPSHRVSLLNDIRMKCKDAIECAPILDEPSWKPSEEQMEALDKAIPVCVGVAGAEEVAPLESLYEQLKKLM